MANSLKETYKKLVELGGFDKKLTNKYKSINDIKRIIESMNEIRNGDNVSDTPDKVNEIKSTTCASHTDISKEIDLNTISLSDVTSTIEKVSALSCATKRVNTCTCQSLITCECNGRTMLCDSQVSYTPSNTYKTVAYNETVVSCSSRVAGYYCDCNSRTSTVYYFCDCNSRTAQIAYYYYTCLGYRQVGYAAVYTCSCDSRISGYIMIGYYLYYYTAYSYAYEQRYTTSYNYDTCSCVTVGGAYVPVRSSTTCSCDSVCTCNAKTTLIPAYTPKYVPSYDSVYAVSYYYPTYELYYGLVAAYGSSNTYASYTSPASTYSVNRDTTYTTKTTYSTVCDCNTRTTTNPCLCNSRSQGLCTSRSGCSCNTVCDCNTVKLFE